jgi:hypothetical protein
MSRHQFSEARKDILLRNNLHTRSTEVTVFKIYTSPTAHAAVVEAIYNARNNMQAHQHDNT